MGIEQLPLARPAIKPAVSVLRHQRHAESAQVFFEKLRGTSADHRHRDAIARREIAQQTGQLRVGHRSVRHVHERTQRAIVIEKQTERPRLACEVAELRRQGPEFHDFDVRRARRQPVEFADKTPRPHAAVLLAQSRLHHVDALAAFLVGHFQRAVDGGGHLIDIMGIHMQRV